MRIASLAVLAAAGSLLLAGSASAQTMHTMTVTLPDGAAAQIQYAGPVPPRVEIVPATAADIAFAPFWPASSDPIFAEMRMISVAMDRDADAMLSRAAAMMNAPAMAGGGDGVWRIDASDMPAGARSYTFSETLGPNGVCRQSMTITSQGPGAKPHVATRQSGTCDNPNASYAVPDEAPATDRPTLPPGTLQVRATPHAGRMMEAMYQPKE